jgi:pimeloyl-ACP methyl ester carboxylesterase
MCKHGVNRLGKEWGDPMKRGYVDIAMGQIHYVSEGSGEPVLLLHQVPLSSKEYSSVIPLIGKRFRAIAMDNPGYGMSDPLPEDASMEQYAECTISFMDALNISKASIVGTHTGASIAVEMTVRHKERIQKLILNGCPVYEPEVRKSRLTDPNYAVMKIEEDGSHLTKIWENQKKWSPNLKPESWHRSVVDYLVAGFHAEDAHQAVFRHDVEPLLPLIKAPTLLISGTEDIFCHLLESTKNLIPNCQTKIIEGGGVVIAYEKAEEFSEAILDFLQGANT